MFEGGVERQLKHTNTEQKHSWNLNLVFKDGVGVLLEEHLVDGHVERRDNLLRVRDQLAAQVRVELPKVAAVEVEERLAHDTYLSTAASNIVNTFPAHNDQHSLRLKHSTSSS